MPFLHAVLPLHPQGWGVWAGRPLSSVAELRDLELTLASYPFTISVFSLRQPRIPVLFLGR